MADTINELFQKYAESVGPALEEDRYFQYLYESLDASDKTITQKSQILHKVVDEAWLSIVEESLDALNNIIEHPRRFIKSTEELVPIDLAKKITAESVRHLSQNTQFINPTEDDTIHPSKILNVTTEESYDLYENRFIYHLIQRLVTFIDKRTDVIFWSTGDETRNVLNFETRVDDAYEQIEYKVEMKITNRQSFAENDADNMGVFMRIDRVRRLVLGLRTSAFCDIMAGCAKVRSPIQRTNLIMKDRDYRKCYALWQFLEKYDEVGYTIVEQDQAYEIDEDYLFHLYTQFITGYSLFKTLSEDKRDLDKVIALKRKTRRPKFIKNIREEIVEDRNIEEVEIRRVFVEEVTQAQLDAEAALAAEQETTASLMGQLDEMYSQVEAANTRAEDAEAALSIADAMRSAAEAAQREAEDRAEQVANDADLRIKSEQENCAKQIAAADSARKAAESERDEANGARSAAEALKDAAEKRAQLAQETADAAIEKATSDIAAARRQAEETIAEAVSEAAEQVAEADLKAAEQIEEAERKSAEQVAAAESRAADIIAETERKASEAIAAAREKAESIIAEAKSIAAKGEAAKNEAEKAVNLAVEERRAADRAKMQAEEEKRQADETAAASMAAKLEAEKLAKAADEARRMETEARIAAEKAKTDAESNAAQVLEYAKKLIEEAKAAKADADRLSKQSIDALDSAREQMKAAMDLEAKSKAEVKAAAARADASDKAEKKALAQYEKEKRARIRAQEKAKEGTLSKYLASLLSGESSKPSIKDEDEEE
ncbi:MAG: DUF2357 domain-containing protein [Clostridia bacterium]|nr:DUF2357 domain-containing protein [Clostridia bacterium]